MLSSDTGPNEETTGPARGPDLQAIARELDECAGEIEARITELEEGQVLTQETLQLEFGI